MDGLTGLIENIARIDLSFSAKLQTIELAPSSERSYGLYDVNCDARSQDVALFHV